MLIGNRTVLQKSLATFRNGTSTAGAYAGVVINNYTNNGTNRNVFFHFNHKNSTPLGYLPPYSFLMPQDEGGMATFNTLNGSMNLTAGNLAGGLNGVAAITGSISITNGDLALIISMVAAITGSGVIDDAQLPGILEASATITATMSITPATLGAILDALATLSASMSVNSDISALAVMTSDITPFTELSPESLAASLLNALLADYNNPGSVGEALNNVGASGNPWASSLSANTTDGTFGARVQKLLTLAQYMGTK